MTLNDTKLRQSVWETVYDLVSAGTYSSTITPTITAAYIEGDHAPFPQIVVNPIDINKTDFTFGNDRKGATNNIVMTIDIFTKKNKDLDVLSDEVDSIMTSRIQGITLISQSENSGTFFPNEQKLRVKTLSYTFIRR